MRAALPFEILASIRVPTWQALFGAVGYPPGLSKKSATSHERIADALRDDLEPALARALFSIAAFATEAARVDVYDAAAALAHAKPLPDATSPADLVAQLAAAATGDRAIAEVLATAQVLCDRRFRPRQTLVFLGRDGVDADVGEPTQYEEPIAKALGAWCMQRGLGPVVSVTGGKVDGALVYHVVHEGRVESVVRSSEVATARTLRSHEIAYALRSGALSITTDTMEAVKELAAIFGHALFSDRTHFLQRAAVDLWPFQQRGAEAVAIKSFAGKLETTAIGGTWHSGKNHSVTPRGLDFFASLERYKIRIEGGRLDVLTLRSRMQRAGDGPEQCDVVLRQPHQVSISEPELAPVVHELLAEAKITTPEPRVRDFFGRQPWIDSPAVWIEAEGKEGFESLVKRKILVADRRNRSVAPPGQPFGDRTATAYAIRGSKKWIAVSADPTVAPFVVTEDDLVVYTLDFGKLAAFVAKELDLEGSATGLDDDGVLRCGRRALGPAQITLSLLTRPVRKMTEQRLQDEAGHGVAILIAPEGRMQKNVLRQVAMPRLSSPFRPLLGAVARALRLESQVETTVYAPPRTRIVVHRATMRVWVDGTLCEYANEMHVRLLECLIEHQGQMVHTKDIAEHVAQGHQHEDTTRRALETFFAAVEKSFAAKKKKPPSDLRKLIKMPKHGRYLLDATAFID